MPDADLTLLLSRGQFATTMGLHIILAAFALGMSPFLVFLEALWLWRKDRHVLETYRFWLKLFALSVAVGAVSGVVMEFQFGTNWGPFARQTGGVIGPLMFYEVLVAFFLESALTGVMILGMDRIGPKLHFFVTCMVAIGALISAFWILAANSWMHTPTGFIRDAAGNFHPQSWLTILQAPSFPWRFMHMVLAALIATASLVAGVGAWRLIKCLQPASAKNMLSFSLWLLLFLLPLQVVIGDLHGENTLKYQPQKIAAMEGSWHQPPLGEGEPLRLFALPDQQAQRNRAQIAIPEIASLYLRHDLHSHIKSLSEFPAQDIPHVATVFYAFRVMVGLGLLMLSASLIAAILRFRRRLFDSPLLLKFLIVLAPAGYFAMLAGWMVTETGRQPWTVWGLLRTEHSFSVLPSSWVIASTAGILLVYLVAFISGMAYFLHYVNSPQPYKQGEVS